MLAFEAASTSETDGLTLTLRQTLFLLVLSAEYADSYVPRSVYSVDMMTHGTDRYMLQEDIEPFSTACRICFQVLSVTCCHGDTSNILFGFCAHYTQAINLLSQGGGSW